MSGGQEGFGGRQYGDISQGVQKKRLEKWPELYHAVHAVNVGLVEERPAAGGCDVLYLEPQWQWYGASLPASDLGIISGFACSTRSRCRPRHCTSVVPPANLT